MQKAARGKGESLLGKTVLRLVAEGRSTVGRSVGQPGEHQSKSPG